MATTVFERLARLKRDYDELNNAYQVAMLKLTEARGQISTLRRENEAFQTWSLWTSYRINYLEQHGP